MRYLAPAISTVLVLLSACGPKTPDPGEQIRAAVQQTVAALPTDTPYPPQPTQTPASLAGLFIEVLWQDAPGVSDPQFMIELILDDRVDTRSGDLNPLLIGDLNVLYVPIATSATPLLPYGGAAAWTCGGRAFAWKAYTRSEERRVG